LFGEENPWMMSIKAFVEVAIKQMGDWFLEGELVDMSRAGMLSQQSLVANVDTAETQYHAHEFLDATVQPKPIYISPNEVYAMHGLLLRHLDALVCFLIRNEIRSHAL
jgi:Ras GTPase-activating-like protein IQGAP2/3